MNDLVTNTMEMSIRVRQFNLTHAEEIPAGSVAAELFALVSDLNDEMRGLAAEQAQAERDYREQVAQKNASLNVLRGLLEMMARTTRAMERTTPNLHERFRLPDSTREQSLIATARAFAAAAVPYRDEFVRHGLPSTFFNDLPARIIAAEQAIELVAQKNAARVNATKTLVDAAKRTRQVVRNLHPVVRNVMAGNEVALAEWERACHIERHARPADDDDSDANTPPVSA